MRPKLFNRKKWSDESGVSEIIGNILILMITVVLFTGIIAFVNQMPVPQMTTKADFSANVSFSESETGVFTADISLTHIGGATLPATDTIVLVSIDSTPFPYRLSSDNEFALSDWATGTSWTKRITNNDCPSLDYSSLIYVTIVDDVKHNAIWTSQLSGGVKGAPPNILQRYVDSNPDTMTVDPIKEKDDFTLYVKVSDDNLEGGRVWIQYLNSEGEWESRDWLGEIPREGGWFYWEFKDFAEDAGEVDGKVLWIKVRDHEQLETVVPFKLSVVVLPSDTTVINIEAEVQEGGMPSYIKNINEGQGFAVFGANATTGLANILDPRTNFTRGERVFVRVASMYVSNTFGGNDLAFVDARSKVDYTDGMIWYGLSSLENPFYNYAYGGSVWIFEAAFETDNMMPGTYTMSMFIKETGTTTYWFKADQTLLIEDSESPITYSPVVWVYKNPTYTQDWGYSKETTFSASGVDCEMYVAIHVQDTDPAPSMGEVRIVDMTGGTQLYGPPGSGSMISTLTPADNGTAYIFKIDLRYSNGDLWKSGTNSYTLQISHFSDNNEGVYAYSRQVFVKGFTSRADFIIGTNGVYSTRGGSTNFINPEYVYYVENNNFFTKRILYWQENAPSTAPLYYHNAMALGDLDNDGDLDLLVGSNMDAIGGYPNLGQLLYFENTLSTYGTWQAPSVITRPDVSTTKIEWIDTGDINGDGYTDFAYSTNGHTVVVFYNTYGTVGTTFKTWTVPDPTLTDGIRKIALRDMTGDGRADLIVLVNGRVEMYDLTRWTDGLFATLPNEEVVTNPSERNIEDFDIADMNNDGMLDIITVDPISGSHADIRGVWVNNYTENQDADVKTLTQDEPSVVSYIGSTADGTSPSDTYTVNDLPFSLKENTTGDDLGQVKFVLKMQPLSSFTDPQLVVRAKVSAGATEVFYVWYTTDNDPATAKYTPVMVISGSTYREYRFDLPPSVVGSANLKIKITDSSTSLGSMIDQIDIDYLAVVSDRFGTYWPNPPATPASRYQVVGVADVYLTARAINFDGLEDGRLEVVVAKDGKFAVYDHKTLVANWVVENADMKVTPTAASYGLSLQVRVSPTLFEVADINGDGLTDILTSWVSTGDDYEVSTVKVYINVGPTVLPWDVVIKDLFAGMLTDTEKGCIVRIVAGDVFLRG